MPENVMCEVSSCTYWGQGNLCRADEIYVVNKEEKQATDSEETDCKTFKPKH